MYCVRNKVSQLLLHVYSTILWYKVVLQDLTTHQDSVGCGSSEYDFIYLHSTLMDS